MSAHTTMSETTFVALDLTTGDDLTTYTLAGYAADGGDLQALRADAGRHGDTDLVAAIDAHCGAS